MELNGNKVAIVDLRDSVRLRSNINLEYLPGKLIATGYKNGEQVASRSLSTTGKPYAIKLSADRKEIKADRNDLAYITVEIIDESGMQIPDADLPVSFHISGKGELAGVGNGNPRDIKSFQQPECTTFRGKCLLIVRPDTSENGEIRVIARANNLVENVLTILVRK